MCYFFVLAINTIQSYLYSKSMAYSGRYTVKQTSKYSGDPTRVFFRSLWERQVFRWLDENPQVSKWSSEEVVVPYRCKTDGRMHRYFVDLKVTFLEPGKTYLIEIKPRKETIAPKHATSEKSKRPPSRKYILEVMKYAKNISKWEAAKEYAQDNGWTFQVWTEDDLKNLGIRLLT